MAFYKTGSSIAPASPVTMGAWNQSRSTGLPSTASQEDKDQDKKAASK